MSELDPVTLEYVARKLETSDDSCPDYQKAYRAAARAVRRLYDPDVTTHRLDEKTLSAALNEIERLSGNEIYELAWRRAVKWIKSAVGKHDE